MKTGVRAILLALASCSAMVSAALNVSPVIAAREGAQPATTVECFVFQPLDGSAPIVSSPTDCSEPRSPASTFKVPHSLFALETGVITPATTMKWDGSKQSFPVWERDQQLDSAMKNSVLWFYQRVAPLIGRARMTAWLKKSHYGSDTYDGEQTQFWINGDLVISPIEQADFLARMFRYELPVSRAHVDAVAAAMLMPAGKISNAAGIHDFAIGWPAATQVRAKTGSTLVKGERVMWLIGHLDAPKRTAVFAALVRSTATLPATAAIDLARTYLAGRR
ncbi:MAG TPA: penicillin-binding transpeptidase domain-containing protein [Vicinamibacterales bacterium]|nr:penicillin-binding transpeptidase domain-containing protein [Vicinamibacterales bacterium]